MTIKFTHSAIVRAPRLLPMYYTPTELGTILGVSERLIRDLWLRNGLLSTRDGGGRIRINGTDVMPWMRRIRQANTKFGRKMAEGEGYCMKCRSVVTMVGPVNRRTNGKQVLYSGICPECGTTVNRGGRNYDQPR